MARSLNKVELIGNLTRDPELRYTPKGTAVCNFGLATNRQWTTDSGEKKEDAEFHRIVAWNKLAELCSQLLSKGRKVYVEGRLQTRRWTAQDGTDRTTTEIVISDMIILDSRMAAQAGDTTASYLDIPEEEVGLADTGVEGEDREAPLASEEKKEVKRVDEEKTKKAVGKKAAKTKKGKTVARTTKKETDSEDSEDIPF